MVGPRTESGKTLAYFTSLLTLLDENNKELQAMILTHELAMQIYRVLEQLVSGTSIQIDVFIEVVQISSKIEKLKQKPPSIGRYTRPNIRA
ncbi:DEAD/DEAH box helicase [Anaerobacillus sp. HL2]|nr:DEAD/DEAH box helicase [Anaerobacillus sp. HL2]